MSRTPRIAVMNASAVAAATVAIVVPARNEEACIGSCLAGLAAQDVDRPPAVYLCVNNTTDCTVAAALDVARETSLAMVLIEAQIAAGGVGEARRIGHSLVVRHSPLAGAVLSTDADCVAAPSWVGRMQMGLRHAPAVLGGIEVRAEELSLFPDSFHMRSRVEARYLELSMEFERLLDRRGACGIGLNTAGGANLGLRTLVYRQVGGYGPLQSGEDRALIERVIRHGYAPIRMAEAVVHASMRTVGRAPGGMADAIAARVAEEECLLDTALAPFDAMLARHAGAYSPAMLMLISEAERDMKALTQFVADLRRIGRVEARRDAVIATYRARHGRGRIGV